MKRFVHNFLPGVAAAMLFASPCVAENVVLTTPPNFQVLSLSPNGKWACGAYVDAAGGTLGFRWNLEGGSLELLATENCVAMDIADDGTVSGDFSDHQATPNGAALTLPGFWRNGKWNHLEMPEGARDGMGYCISPDGHYMTGSVTTGPRYQPYIWKDGMIHRSLDTGADAVGIAVAPDGEGAAGFDTKGNRQACYWKPDGNVRYFDEAGPSQKSPWNYARNFSPDGSMIVLWGGWESNDAGEYSELYTIYHIATDSYETVPYSTENISIEFFDIANDGTCVGTDENRGRVLTNGDCMFIDDYLAYRGVDLSSFGDFYDGEDYYVGQLPIPKVSSINADGSVISLQYYNKMGYLCSMIVKMDQDLSAPTPAEVTARQLEGVPSVALAWKRPVGNASIRGYNVYRNGVKVSGFMPLNKLYFYDKDLEYGTYTYEVSAVSTTGVETRAEALEVDVEAPSLPAPIGLFARQKGVNNAFISWNAPLNNVVHKRLFDISAEISGFGVYTPVEAEFATCYDQNELACYKGFEITEVSFMPMAAHNSWAINIYTRDSSGNLQLLYNQPVTGDLRYNEFNTVVLDSPLPLPDGDLIVAVDVEVDTRFDSVIGAENAPGTPGRSDLLREASEPDFFSVYESSVEGMMNIVCLSWAIDLGLSSEGGDTNPMSYYQVYLDDELVDDTDGNTSTIDALEDGTYRVEVEAVYTDGTPSPRLQRNLEIAADYPAINNFDLDVDTETLTVNAAWKAPEDNDATKVSYSDALTNATGIMGNPGHNYEFMAAAEYPFALFKGYEGYKVGSFSFYPLANADFTFVLYENAVKVAELEVPEYELHAWNEVDLDQLVTIKPAASYRLAISCRNPEPDVAVMALDNGVPVENYSDLFSQSNGTSWQSLSGEGLVNGNWMIGMTLLDPDGHALAVDGYNVVIDNVVSNPATLSETTYSHTFAAPDTQSHSIRIDTYYPALAEAVKGNSRSFTIAVDGIEPIAAEGNAAKTILYDLSGRRVVDTNAAPGFYVAPGRKILKK